MDRHFPAPAVAKLLRDVEKDFVDLVREGDATTANVRAVVDGHRASLGLVAEELTPRPPTPTPTGPGAADGG